MKHASLFSGIGGFDLAAEWMGWENLFHCEWNEFGQKVLNHYWPEATSYADITKTDFTIWRGRVDILTGGFPCQPYSHAGKRLGKADERHLWPEMLRAIREIAPRYVVAENVSGLISWNDGLVFNEVQTDLEAAGYEVQPFVLPACATNAPHRRDRVWFIAHSINNGNLRSSGRLQSEAEKENGRGQERSKPTRQPIQQPNQPSGLRQPFTNTKSGWHGGLRNESQEARPPKSREPFRSVYRIPFAANAQLHGYFTTKRGRSNGAPSQWCQKRPHSAKQFARVCTPAKLGGLQQDAFYTNSTRQQKRHVSRITERQKQFNWKYNADPTNWQNFPTQPPICGRNDGLPTELDGVTFPKWRNESIKAYGNAIVPAVALQIFKALVKTEANLTSKKK